MGNAHPSIVPYQLFPASDGHLIIACGNDRQFTALCQTLDLPDMAANPAYGTNPQRVAERETLCARIAEKTMARTRTDLLDALEKAGVPAGPINTVAEAIGDPQIAARGMVIAPEGIPGLRTPLTFSRSPLVLDKAGPALGTGAWTFTGTAAPDEA